MSDASGERFAFSGSVPRAELQYHLSRYQFAALYARGRTVLDVACGTGYGTCLLSHVASHVIGADISLETLSSARRRYHAANLQYVCLDAQKLPFRDNSFDVVVSLETIEHLVEPTDFLEECVRILRRGGLLVLSTPNKGSHFWLSGVAQESPLAKGLLGRIGGLRRLLVNPFHHREFTYHELRGLVGSCLDIQGVYGISKLSRTWVYARGIVRSGGLGRVWWEATKLIGFLRTLLGSGPFVDANGVGPRPDAPIDPAFMPFALDGPSPVEYFIVVASRR